MTERKMVRVGEYSLDFSIDGTLANARKWLTREAKSLRERGATQINLDTQSVDYGEGNEVVIVGYRPETAEETTARELREAEYKAQSDEYDRQQLERLKKKFGEA